MKNEQPIGFFDSGIGGTSIWSEVHALLPNEHTIYLADSKNAPYGNKHKDVILDLSIKNTERLMQMGCKLIVVACNTATTNAIATLRSRYDIPFIGIEPAIKPAALNTTTKSIGILATKGTLASDLFHETTEAFAQDIRVTEVIGEGLVPLVEAGKMNAAETKLLLEKYIAPMIAAKVDHIVLGCTHYPYLIPVIKTMVPAHVQIIDSGAAVAKQTQAVLAHHDLLRKDSSRPKLNFFTNGNRQALEQVLGRNHQNCTVEELAF